VHDYTVRRHVLDALAAGVPKAEALRWVVDLSRDFYVADDASFERAWFEHRGQWERLCLRRHKRRMRATNAGNSPRPPGSAGEPGGAGGSPPTPLPWRRGAPSDAAEVKSCAARARADCRSGICASYEQALAVHLAIALGGDAARVLAEAGGGGVSAPSGADEGGGGGEVPSAKRLALLVHPDKTSHPRAKEAFQRLAPSLRYSR